MSPKLLVAACAAAASAAACQPHREVGNASQPHASGAAAMSQTDPAAPSMRLSYWGVGSPPPSGPVGGAAARFEGVLGRVGGCLVVAADNGVRVQPVFPAGRAGWDADLGRLSFAGRTYRPGERIVLGGGGVAAPAAYAREAGVSIAPCAVADLFVVVG